LILVFQTGPDGAKDLNPLLAGNFLLEGLDINAFLSDFEKEAERAKQANAAARMQEQQTRVETISFSLTEAGLELCDIDGLSGVLQRELNAKSAGRHKRLMDLARIAIEGGAELGDINAIATAARARLQAKGGVKATKDP